MIKNVVAFLCFSCLFTARADVVPYMAILIQGETLTIPSGKILVIEQYQSTLATVSLKIFNNNAGSGISAEAGEFITVNLVNPNNSPASLTTLERPLRVKGENSIRNESLTTNLIIIGLAIDEADLYAAVPNQLDSIGIEGQNAKVLASIASPRPVIRTVETTTDLSTWERDSSATVTPVGGPTQVEAVTGASEDVKAVRIQTRARQID